MGRHVANMMDQRLPVLLLAIALLGVAEVSSTYVGTCAFTNSIPSSSGAYITISQDSAGVDVASEYWAKSETAAFGETVYFECSNASIANTMHYANVWDDATGAQIVSAKEMTTAFSCQARNVLSVYPSTYGNGSVQIGRIYSQSDIPAGTCQTSFVNYGYDGGANFFYQSYALGNSDTYDSSWNYLGAIPFGSSGTVPGSCTGTSRVMAIASDQQTILAVSSYETLTSDDAETGTFYFLEGESGSNVMNYVRGCESGNSSCGCVERNPTTNTTCYSLKFQYQENSCCSQDMTKAAIFDTVNVTCGNILSSYTGSECCDADLAKNATMSFPTNAPTHEPTHTPTSEATSTDTPSSTWEPTLTYEPTSSSEPTSAANQADEKRRSRITESDEPTSEPTLIWPTSS